MNTEVAQLLLKKYGKHNAPGVRAGDTVKVHQKIREGEKERVQIFEGLVISVKHGVSLNASFTVRKIAVGGIGVERTYPLHSPNIVKVERIKSADVSRSKLYYMRDRLGKAARFKNENRTGFVWDESGKPSAIEVTEEEIPAEITEETIAEETVIAAIEGADAVAVEEIPADVAAEEAPEEQAPATDEAK